MATKRRVVYSRLAFRLLLAAGASALVAGCSDASRFSADPFSDPFGSSTPQRTVDRAPTRSIPSKSKVAYNAPVEQRPLAPLPSAQPAPAAVAPAVPAAATPAKSASGSFGHWSPEGGASIVVAQGETAPILATRYGVPTEALLRVNGFSASSQVQPGAHLIVPVYRASAAAATPAPAPAETPKATPTPAPAHEKIAHLQPAAKIVAPKPHDAPKPVAKIAKADDEEEKPAKAPAPHKAEAKPVAPHKPAVKVAAKQEEDDEPAKPSKHDEKKAVKSKPAAVVKATRPEEKFDAPVKPKAKTEKLAKAEEAPPKAKTEKLAKVEEAPPKAKPKLAAVETRPEPAVEKKVVARSIEKTETHAPTPEPESPKQEVDRSAVNSVPRTEKPAETVKVATNEDSAADKFRWPAKGRVIQGFTAGGNDGINIAVPEGTQVKAAEGGVVAYAGSELKGYGNLVLIKHPNGFVTAYAHNGELDVKRGDKVARGQTIAKSGQSGNVASPQLHFELRKGSTPVDPTSYLAGL